MAQTNSIIPDFTEIWATLFTDIKLLKNDQETAITKFYALMTKMELFDDILLIKEATNMDFGEFPQIEWLIWFITMETLIKFPVDVGEVRGKQEKHAYKHINMLGGTNLHSFYMFT